VTEHSDRHLVVLIGGRRAGTVAVNTAGRFSLIYDDVWRETRSATPLSLSMPLAQPEHGDAPVRAFLWGLLPDNERVLERWARTYHVSARNPFALLRHVGEDCAGAAQFVTPERVDTIVAGDGNVNWLTRDEVADRLRILHKDPTAWHLPTGGQFSLAGAQAKTALHYDPRTRRWGNPRGAVPTTHILKPAVTGLDEHDLNEHLCLSAARNMGLIAASSEVASFRDERVIVVERYDRRRAPDGSVIRIHQEDICQALGVQPTAKYQNEGGPGPEQIIELLRNNIVPSRSATASVGRFVDALAFNWIIGGTDAHAKNYSVLLSGPQVRLAPLYDIASALAYEEMYPPKLKMAMKIGGEYGVETTSGRHWRRFAITNGLDADETVARVDHLAEQAPEAFGTVATSKSVSTLGSELPARLVERIASRAAACRSKLKS
jgi:serine/threonine-protein kinase HipA